MPNQKKPPAPRKTLKEYASDAAARLKKSPNGLKQPNTAVKRLSKPQNRGK